MAYRVLGIEKTIIACYNVFIAGSYKMINPVFFVQQKCENTHVILILKSSFPCRIAFGVTAFSKVL